MSWECTKGDFEYVQVTKMTTRHDARAFLSYQVWSFLMYWFHSYEKVCWNQIQTLCQLRFESKIKTYEVLNEESLENETRISDIEIEVSLQALFYLPSSKIWLWMFVRVHLWWSNTVVLFKFFLGLLSGRGGSEIQIWALEIRRKILFHHNC